MDKGTPLYVFLKTLEFSGGKPVFARVDGHIVDLDYKLEKDEELDWIFRDSQEALDILRHSTAHLMAQAVLDLFPETQTGIGPAVENGFYYDFYRAETFTPDDLAAIEKRMHQLAQDNFPVERIEMPKAEARRLFQSMNHDLKDELIEEKGGVRFPVSGRVILLISASVLTCPLPE